MLAFDDESGPGASVRFSRESDIVELVVLTTDEVFLKTLRNVITGARRIWHVVSADKVSDLLVAGEVGILVLDVQALSETPSIFIGQLKRQFPDLVIVVAGFREAENSLSGLISVGTVYRFIHKPMSAGRVKLFADAAVKKYEEQRKHKYPTTTAPLRLHWRSGRGALVGGVLGTLSLLAIATWTVHYNPAFPGKPRTASTAQPAATESSLLTRAAAAMAANRLTEPAGDNALELYLQARTQNPTDPLAQAGIAEARERLLSKAENALLEERLDDAAKAIEVARQSGADSSRVGLLTMQLAKSREVVKTAQASIAGQGKVDSLLGLAAQRIKESRLINPERDNALFYIKEALRLDPTNDSVLKAKNTLGMQLLTEAHGAIDHRDFMHAAAWIEAAKGLAPASVVEATLASLTATQRQIDAETWAVLLENGTERLQQDRLIEPANDSAKYYLMTLKSVNPSNAGLPAAIQELETRLIAKARRATALEQYDAARSWLAEASGLGAVSADLNAAEHELQAAMARQELLASIIPGGELTLIKSVKPVYPPKAQLSKIEGWVELDFTVAENGTVKDVTVHAANPLRVFDSAAINAVSQWRYKPVLIDGKAVARRARIRTRFMLTN